MKKIKYQQEIKILVEELSKVEDRAVYIASGNTGMVDVAIVWNESTQFVVTCCLRTRYGFTEEQPLFNLHNILTIRGFMDSYVCEKIESAIARANNRIEATRKDAE